MAKISVTEVIKNISAENKRLAKQVISLTNKNGILSRKTERLSFDVRVVVADNDELRKENRKLLDSISTLKTQPYVPINAPLKIINDANKR